MSNFYPPAKFATIMENFIAQPAVTRAFIEVEAGVNFPADDVRALMADQTYENLERADARMQEFAEAITDEVSATLGIDRLMSEIAEFRPFRVSIMPEYVCQPGGGLMEIPHFAPHKPEQERYGSAGQAAVAGAVDMTVFRHALKSEKVYNGQEALDARASGQLLLDPVGVRASYRIAVYNGDIMSPACHPDDLPDREVTLEDEGMSL